MNRAQFTVAPDLVLDARRAVWLRATRTLAVADLHAGYVWAHRYGGQLLPLTAREDTVDRLLELIEDYGARELVLLGDIVHAAVRVAELKAELCALFDKLRARVALTCVAGNHDRKLARLLRECGIDAALVPQHASGPHLLMHGDGADRERAQALLAEAAQRGGRVFIGHEHPAISLSDGVAHHAKCHCFLIAPELIVLPAFSPWAAGSNVRTGRFMSAFAQEAKFETAVAILTGRLLPLALCKPPRVTAPGRSIGKTHSPEQAK